MTTMVTEIYDALIAAGAPADKARAAAKAVAENDGRFGATEKKLIEHDGKFTLLQWMLGFNLAFSVAVLWKVFS